MGDDSAVTVKALCEEVDMSTQNFYQKKKRRKRRQIDEELVVELVKNERKVQPNIGTRKLYKLLKPEFEKAGVRIGRDRLFDVLRKHDLLIKRKRRNPRTTNSNHFFSTYENTFKEMTPAAPHQAWVSDLTYLRLEDGFAYVALITDAYSRKIVGYDVGGTLEATGCLQALEQAISQMPEGARPLHHSDRGTQYCCHAYVNKLQDNDIGISMTEDNHCYENAMAERVNGILKQEYGLGETFRTLEAANVAVKQAVQIYNTRRPHVSLDYRKPCEVHRRAA
jgi:transposase InsO family protein